MIMLKNSEEKGLSMLQSSLESLAKNRKIRMINERIWGYFLKFEYAESFIGVTTFVDSSVNDLSLEVTFISRC